MPTQVQRQNFATAFGLAHSSVLSNAMRNDGGAGRDIDFVPFMQFRWLGQEWLTRPPVPFAAWSTAANLPQTILMREDWPWRWPFAGSHLFAIRRDVAEVAMGAFMGQEGIERRALPFEVMSQELRDRARQEERGGGAVFANGLAVLSGDADIDSIDFVSWWRSTGNIE